MPYSFAGNADSVSCRAHNEVPLDAWTVDLEHTARVKIKQTTQSLLSEACMILADDSAFEMSFVSKGSAKLFLVLLHQHSHHVFIHTGLS